MVAGAVTWHFWTQHTFCFQSLHLFRVIFGYISSVLQLLLLHSRRQQKKIRPIYAGLIYSLYFILANALFVDLRNKILPHSCECHCPSLSFCLSFVKPVLSPCSLYFLRVRGSSFLSATLKGSQRLCPKFLLAWDTISASLGRLGYFMCLPDLSHILGKGAMTACPKPVPYLHSNLNFVLSTMMIIQEENNIQKVSLTAFP